MDKFENSVLQLVNSLFPYILLQVHTDVMFRIGQFLVQIRQNVWAVGMI